MKILVIGGSGFLGSHVADYLSDDGHDVTIYDIHKSKWLKDNQKMIVGSVLNDELLCQSIMNVDVVYLFASLADLDDLLHKPVETAEVNILGAVKVLDACVKFKIKKFIYASTVYVYSREGGFYRCSKQAVEAYIEEFNRLYNLKYTIFRYGSLYGPRADKSNGLKNIISDALEHGYVSYQGSPDSEREYIHVYDAAKASSRALEKEFENESIVLTGHEQIKMVDLLKMISEILNYKKEIKFLEKDYEGHYIKTPYAYQPKLGRKYVPSLHVDLGQGILDIINEIGASNN